MHTHRIRRGLVLTIMTAALGLGCELIVDFDRTKIPVEDNNVDSGGITTDAAKADVAIPIPDASTDAGPG